MSAFLVLVLAVGAAGAATFIVNSTADTTDGSCDTVAGGCTLREAIEAAVATAGRDTIKFDATVFPKGAANNFITLASPLPSIADPAGTVVDGAGGNVLISGGGTVSEGLVFESAPGTPLTKVTVANVIVASFTGTAVHICGGTLPTCAGDVSDVLVRNVITSFTTDGDGIRIEGPIISKPRIIDSVVFHVGGAGIRILADDLLVGARVQGVTARDCGQGGIDLFSIEKNVGSTIVDSIALANAAGIAVIGSSVSKAKLTNVVAHDNDDLGVGIVATQDTTSAVSVSDVMASHNAKSGIRIDGTTGNTKPTFTNVVADGNQESGVLLKGLATAAKITGARATANGSDGVTFADDVTDAAIDRVIAAANGRSGMSLRMFTSVGRRINAAANDEEGIFLGPPTNGIAIGPHNNTLEKSAAPANSEIGIEVGNDDLANLLQKNVALGNALYDLADMNADCDSTTWLANVFRTSNLPCVH